MSRCWRASTPLVALANSGVRPCVHGIASFGRLRLVVRLWLLRITPPARRGLLHLGLPATGDVGSVLHREEPREVRLDVHKATGETPEGVEGVNVTLAVQLDELAAVNLLDGPQLLQL